MSANMTTYRITGDLLEMKDNIEAELKNTTRAYICLNNQTREESFLNLPANHQTAILRERIKLYHLILELRGLLRTINAWSDKFLAKVEVQEDE